MKPLNNLKTKRMLPAVAAFVLSVTVSTPAAGHDAPAIPYQMAVIVDDAHGRAVVSGKYDAAIDKITDASQESSEDFSEQLSLCVAYTKTNVLDKARGACDAAIASVSEQDGLSSRSKNKRRPAWRVDQSHLAVALSNRGVLLAITGDTERARRDFVKAMEIDTRHSRLAAANLDRLEQVEEPDA